MFRRLARCLNVLSLAKVDAVNGRTGRYYTDSVASGAEDYYAGRGESSGVWIGEGTTRLGLAGVATTAEFHAVLNGRDPRDGRIMRSGPRASTGELREGVIRGFDLTFSAPKSVSVLWAAGNDEIARQVQSALDVATADALTWLEREACVVRRGKGGVFEFKGGGFVGVAFRHRTSRAQDPQLHTHVVVSNMAQGPDDRWTALRGALLYRHARTAGFVFQAVLREELSQRLGVEWIDSSTPGVREVAGVPDSLCDEFSTRRKAIEAAMARLAPSASAAQVAALATRPPKRAEAPEGATFLRQAWQERAVAHGFDGGAVKQALGRAQRRDGVTDEGLEQELTREQSSFGRGDVTRVVADAADQGATLIDIVERVDGWLASPSAVPLAHLIDGAESRLRDAPARTGGPRADRWTTRDHLAVERGLVACAMRRRGAGAGITRPEVVEGILARANTATPDQRLMVRELCSRGDGVHVVRASAGAGKTWTLDLARQAWEAAELPVIGVAQARRAALEMREQAGITNATSIAALEADLDRNGTGLPARCVLVVDEAAMVDTRTTARLADRVERADGLLVLCGDDRQINEIGAGGAFAGLARRLGATTLDGNRRQRSEHERLKERLLRLAVPEAYLRTATDAGELVFCADVLDARELMIGEWLREASASGPGEHVMIARSREDVDWLNDVACSVLRRTSSTDADAVEVGGREFAVGDWVIARRNWPGGELVNGMRATVAGIDHETGVLSLSPLARPGDRIDVPRTYLDQGHLHHGYALTAHLAQGMSVERVSVLGANAPERGWTYSALTRHREGARMYVAAPPALRPEIPQDVAGELDAEDVLGREATKALALDTLPDGRRARGLDELRERMRELDRLVREVTAATTELTSARSQLVRLAEDPDPDDLAVAAARRWAAEVERLKGEPLLTLDTEALRQEAGSARSEFEARLGFETNRAVAVALTIPPGHVAAMIGERPHDAAEAREWDRAVWRVETYRLRHLDQRARVDHGTQLGPEPTLPDARRDWATAQQAILQVRPPSANERRLVR